MRHKNIFKLVVIVICSLSAVYGCGGGSSSGNGGKGNGSVGTVTLNWDAPNTNADGTPLTDLARYRVYYGSAPLNYSIKIETGRATCSNAQGKTICSYVITNLPHGTHYFAVTAYDFTGNESIYSNEISKPFR